MHQTISYSDGESWTYNAMGQVLSYQAPAICCTEPVNYTYDALNRLREVAWRPLQPARNTVIGGAVGNPLRAGSYALSTDCPAPGKTERHSDLGLPVAWLTKSPNP